MSSASYTNEEIEEIGNEARECGYAAGHGDGRSEGRREGLRRAIEIADSVGRRSEGAKYVATILRSELAAVEANG